MFNKVQIILDKGKTKSKMFIFYDLTDVIYIIFAGFIGLAIGDRISPLYKLGLGLTLAGIVAFLRFQMNNMFSVYEYLKMAYKYYFKLPKKYVYYPNTQVIEKEKNDDERKEYKETKIFHKKQKRKRKGKTIKE